MISSRRRRRFLLFGGEASPFDPTKLPNIVALYDISRLDSLFQEIADPETPAAVDGPVGTIVDLTGNGNDWIAPTEGQRPILRESNGIYWLEFDGEDDELVMPANVIDHSNDLYVITAGKWRDVQNDFPYWIGTDPLDNGTLFHINDFGPDAWAGVLTDNAGFVGDYFDPGIGGTHVYEIAHKTSEGTTRVRMDGTEIVNVSVEEPTEIVPPSGSYLIGTRAAEIDVHVMAILNGAGVADIDWLELRKWAAGKAGVTL